jgi:hypothetical protein
MTAILANDCTIRALWLIATPFGLPVVPDVKHISATESGPQWKSSLGFCPANMSTFSALIAAPHHPCVNGFAC